MSLADEINAIHERARKLRDPAARAEALTDARADLVVVMRGLAHARTERSGLNVTRKQLSRRIAALLVTRKNLELEIRILAPGTPGTPGIPGIATPGVKP